MVQPCQWYPLGPTASGLSATDLIRRILREDLQANRASPQQIRVATGEVLLVLDGAVEDLLVAAMRAGMRRRGADVVLDHVRDLGLKEQELR